MPVTETIQEILQGIDEAQYGRDMRDNIHKGIQKCYEEGSAGETDLEARERLDALEPASGTMWHTRLSIAGSDIRSKLNTKIGTEYLPTGTSASLEFVFDNYYNEDLFSESKYGDYLTLIHYDGEAVVSGYAYYNSSMHQISVIINIINISSSSLTFTSNVAMYAYVFIPKKNYSKWSPRSV